MFRERTIAVRTYPQHFDTPAQESVSKGDLHLRAHLFAGVPFLTLPALIPLLPERMLLTIINGSNAYGYGTRFTSALHY